MRDRRLRLAPAGGGDRLNIVWVRRVSQVFFLCLFLWFCFAMTLGTGWWELRGWPVNLFLELDPLVAVGTLLTTHTIYKGLLWALLTVAVTVVCGRVFCGWVCPFGTLHHFFGWLGSRRKGPKVKMEKNRYRRAQVLKYYILIAFLVMAALPLGNTTTLLTGILDPIPLVHRSVNLTLMPIGDALGLHTGAIPRHYAHAWVIGAVFVAALLANLSIPRFYCRFLCPTGALLGILSRFTIWRIAKKAPGCTHCDLCESHCEGAADPAIQPRIAECVMCLNCVNNYCNRNLITYRTRESIDGDIPEPRISRRGLFVSLGAGAVALPMLRLGAELGDNYSHLTIRPPGTLPEADFLQRCIKCGQCMRICPTNIIMPAGLDTGLEGMWTPVLNFRIGTSGCQLNCVACGHVCPTAAIRPLTLDEKHGEGEFAEAGPVRIGTAFVDRGRCLPWAMDTPCLVCEENCPVTPKAIFVRETWETVRHGTMRVRGVDGAVVSVEGRAMTPGAYATGDFFADSPDLPGTTVRITANTADSLTLAEPPAELHEGATLHVRVHLEVPHVDPDLCIGCGVCEHECPVTGLRAIRVSAENESRNSRSSLKIRRAQT